VNPIPEGQIATFDQNVANRRLARFIGSSTVSFRQASSPEFASFSTYLNPEYRHPSRQTLVKHIFEEADRAANLLKQLLDEAPIVSAIFNVL